MNRLVSTLVLCFAWCASSFAATSSMERAATGTWYNPQTSGQGLLVSVLAGAPRNQLFVGWYTHASDGSHKLWLVMQGDSNMTLVNQPLTVFMTGYGNFNAGPRVWSTPVGTATLTMTSASTMSVAYSFGIDSALWDRSGTMTLSKLSPAPASTLTAADLSLRGVWYDPEKSGQGLQFDVIPLGGSGNLAFGAWYTYSAAGHERLWLTLSGMNDPASGARELGIYVAGEGRFNKSPGVSSERVGTAIVTPIDTDLIQIDFAFDRSDVRWEDSGTMTLVRVAPSHDMMEPGMQPP